MAEYKLELRGVCKSFPGVKALDNVQLSLRPGTVHALMGENGAGKSTLIKCLTGINAFEAGEIHVEGIDGPVVNHSTLDAQKKGISTVYQEVNLCPHLSVAENLFIGREPKTKLRTIDWKTMVAKSEKIMDSLDIKIGTKAVSNMLNNNDNRTFAHELGHSGGLDHTMDVENLMTRKFIIQKEDGDYLKRLY